ncbi:DUF456 domain-containing protein [Saccharibacillus brassicae]|uniref:Glycine zipper-like domain-containing protein n=1 Tax=Saccharibacillus brassicae TaxID=2583377 RepID=A0A4Y6UPX5_SACBS|nr:DUF456 domain-containing protein [Saccharibacillus brassicae]QDH19683.1 hypothetical protein FFV09_01675 [Saccharibacillus brassicae]
MSPHQSEHDRSHADPSNKPQGGESRPTEQKWLGFGLAIGSAFGLLIGLFLKNVAIGLPLGMALGLIFGTALQKSKDEQKRKDEQQSK